jgi:RNA polymerase sigma-70 factor (ECF subfamily)
MARHTLSDQELIKLFISGQDSAFDQLLKRTKDKVYTAIYIMVKDQYLAEDLFQETFIKVIDTLRQGKYNDEGKFQPWVLRIAYNICIDHFRKLKRNPSVVTSEGDDVFNYMKFDETPIDKHIDLVQSESKLKNLIDMLPEDQKEVVMLRHYFDFSFKEIAEYSKVSINTSLGRMRYALINLRKLIETHQLEIVRMGD